MVKFIELIQDIGFVNIKSEIPEFIRYNFDDYMIIIVSNQDIWLISKSITKDIYFNHNNWTWVEFNGKFRFEFNEIDLLKDIFKSYFRDIKIKELGI